MEEKLRIIQTEIDKYFINGDGNELTDKLMHGSKKKKIHKYYIVWYMLKEYWPFHVNCPV